MKILSVFGTRPEAIKMAPLLRLIKDDKSFEIKICVTAQHREMLDQVLKLFNIIPDYDFNIMYPMQDLTNIICFILKGLKKVFNEFQPDIVLVHGDTVTTMAASISSFYHRINIGHIEAGLRTGNLYFPWPEEGNRKIIANLALYHFTPTYNSRKNLLKELIPNDNIFVTGNTVIDSLLWVCNKIKNDKNISEALKDKYSFIDFNKKIILVTSHRRENFGKAFKNICFAILEIIKNHLDVQIIYSVHLNPNVSEPINYMLRGIDRVILINPQEYLSFVYLMNLSYLILTDSGGIQEEAPFLGKPVLIMRNQTERSECIKAGVARLVGTNTEKIVKEVNKLLIDKEEYKNMSQIHNLYGDGKACYRIIKVLKKIRWKYEF
ncbi:non-hydrolyzing UDP-N-acetylglucosamine 2-epimerase [Candidatus Providencia siddallii]|uniref:UDP-N-acetylglucosamine 2-epimerase (non-hydrolyzing) n=1 Tax=Candidatus Providencia siddallii TaxID=1715285 RepID=A0ABM9NPM7_9GAMM